MRTAILSSTLIVATMAGAAALGQGGPAALVADLADGPAGAAPFQSHKLTALGDTLFFAAHGVAGFELLRTAGTAAGTALVADVCPGPCSSGPHSGGLSGYSSQGFFVLGPVAAGGELFFVADDGVRGFELWNTDGTASGTRPVDDFDPYCLYFAADDGVRGRELWVTDGTAAGTELVADVMPGSGSSYPEGLTVASDRLVFAASDGKHGRELWQSRLDDGRTGLVQDLGGAGSSSPRHLTVSGPRLYFNAFTEDAGFKLWSAALAELPDVTPCPLCPVFP